MKTFFPHFIRKVFRDEKHWEDLDFFRGVFIFKGLSSRELGRIMQAMQKRHYHAGEVLFSEGQSGRAVFIIRSGQVELTRRISPNKQRRLGVLRAGQIFGEMALLEKLERTATATIKEDGEIYLLYTSTLDSLVKRSPTIGVKLLTNISRMLSALLRETNARLDPKSHMEKAS